MITMTNRERDMIWHFSKFIRRIDVDRLYLDGDRLDYINMCLDNRYNGLIHYPPYMQTIEELKINK